MERLKTSMNHERVCGAAGRGQTDRKVDTVVMMNYRPGHADALAHRPPAVGANCTLRREATR
jgi:hypothetical protein